MLLVSQRVEAPRMEPHIPPSQLDWLADTCCAQGVCGQRLYPWGQWRASGAQAWEMQRDAGFGMALYSERCLIATMSH
ncbi:hypothetical protein BTVI_83310 [Pitangus sulphuratus]|nr:hypothetical protein BTVI_83310 [Pitangus sulphuratus]